MHDDRVLETSSTLPCEKMPPPRDTPPIASSLIAAQLMISLSVRVSLPFGSICTAPPSASPNEVPTATELEMRELSRVTLPPLKMKSAPPCCARPLISSTPSRWSSPRTSNRREAPRPSRTILDAAVLRRRPELPLLLALISIRTPWPIRKGSLRSSSRREPSVSSTRKE